jgi:hypothetical protein
MELRDELEGRKHGVELMENFFTHLQGSAETSFGTEWVATVDGTSGVLFGFPVALLTSFMIVIDRVLVRVFDRFGPVKLGDVISNSYFNRGLANWQVSVGAGLANDYLPGGALLSGGLERDRISYISQTVTVVIGTSYELTVDVLSGEDSLVVQVGSAVGLTDILDNVVTGTGRFTIPDLVSTTTEMWVRLMVMIGGEDKVITGVHLYDPTVGDVAFAGLWPSMRGAPILQARMTPEETALMITSTEAPPQKLSLSSTDVWSMSALALVSPPTPWAAGNYPPALGFHQGRLWVGGMPSDPSLVWGSKSNVYGDFSPGTALPAEAIEMRVGRDGAVCWIASGSGLIIGTSNSEHIIASEGDVITPGDKYSQLQSTNGSYPAQCLEVGNEVMYISPDGRKIRSIGYEWLKDAWRSQDLTHASEHITGEGRAVTQLRYSANPDSIITGLSKSGTLINATYEPYSQTAGFSRRSTQGTIVGIGSTPFNGTDELWVLVHRGGDQLYLERERTESNVKLDSHTRIIQRVPGSFAPVSGGTVLHLAEKLCQVVVDGAVHPDVIPDEFGEFTTEYGGTEIFIGLAVASTIRTLPVADRIANIGTTRTMKKRFSEIWVRILNSYPPKINGRRAPDRSPGSLMGEVEPPRTESIEIANDGWDMDAQVTIVQDLPLRTEIAGWFGRLLQEEI